MLTQLIDLMDDEQVVANCNDLTARLSNLGSPADLAARSALIRDEVMRSAIDSIRAAAIAAVASCQGHSTNSDTTTKLLDAIGLARQREAQLRGAQ